MFCNEQALAILDETEVMDAGPRIVGVQQGMVGRPWQGRNWCCAWNRYFDRGAPGPVATTQSLHHPLFSRQKAGRSIPPARNLEAGVDVSGIDPAGQVPFIPYSRIFFSRLLWTNSM